MVCYRLDMTADERHRLMTEMLQHQERIEVDEFAARCATSAATIRRDLDLLEQRGVLRRVHGAAVSLVLGGYEPGYAQRVLENRWSKAALAQKVDGLVQDREFVFLDSGSTATQIASVLQQRLLTVFPASLHAVNELIGGRSRIIVPGGDLSEGELAFQGPMAERNIAALRFDTAIITPCAFDLSTGIMAYDLADAAIKRAAIASAKRVIVVCDQSKWERHAPAVVAGPDQVDQVVTDHEFSQPEIAAARAAQVEVTSL